MDKRTLGARIAEVRRSRGLTQAETAKLAGLSKGYLSCIERGQNAPTTATLDGLARAFKTDVRCILYGSLEEPFAILQLTEEETETIIKSLEFMRYAAEMHKNRKTASMCSSLIDYIHEEELSNE